MDQGNTTSRAAGGRNIRVAPVLVRSPDGQVLRTGSFIEQGSVSAGVTAAGNTSDTLFVALPGAIESYDFATLQLAGSTPTGCAAVPATRLIPFDSDQSFFILQGSNACIFASLSRSMPTDPFAALRFPDLALEECVINAAMTSGFTQPEQFVQLDCSTTPGSIRSLDTIDRLVNLESLNVANSSVFDLSPLATMASLQNLVVGNAAITDISPLSGFGPLISLDLRGNDSVPYVDLNQLVISGVSVLADQCTQDILVELGGIGADMEVDEANNRVFVSIPSLQRVAEINLNTAVVVQRHTLPAQPFGIDLSSDNITLYTTLNGLGDIAYLNVVDGIAAVVDLSAELGDERTWDIAEVSPNRIVVSANPSSSGLGLSFIVEVRRDLGNTATRVGSDIPIRKVPVFAVSADQLAVYIGEGPSPLSLFKLDAAQPDLPLVLEDTIVPVSGTNNLSLSPDGTRIYLASGQALSTATFTQVSQFPGGRSALSADGTKLLIADGEATAAGVYDTTTTAKIGRRQWGCNILNLQSLKEFGGDGVIILGDDLICYSVKVPFP